MQTAHFDLRGHIARPIGMKKRRRHKKQGPAVHPHLHRIGRKLGHGDHTEEKQTAGKQPESLPNKSHAVSKQSKIGND